MFDGTVVSINVAHEESGPMTPIEQVRAIAGRGLDGDRYCKPEGQIWDDPGKELTLIESEALEALTRESGVAIEHCDARRNIVTRGVPLNHLVDKEFTIGAVRARGIRLNEPCAHLASLTDERLLRGLVHRGGLRARILNDGVIRVGDTVREA